MPVLQRFADCRIAMYPRDHVPPHVHVEFRNGDRCTVVLETLAVTGRIRPVRRLAPALAWIHQHRASLRMKWKELNR